MSAFLIADDSRDKIRMLRHFLKMAKWQGDIVTAETCDEAYELIKKHSDITCAFVDFYIPKDNGPAIIRALKTSHPMCRVALVSSADDAANATEARQAGAEAVVCSTRRSDEVEKQILDLLAEWQADQNVK